MALPLERGKIVVDRCLRVQGLDDVWALGDNARIPLGDPSDPNVAYAPPLAQFAVREAKVLAGNILSHLKGEAPKPFAYRSLGTMASLGGRTGVADILGVKITGFLAWAAWRTFYLSLLPSIRTRIRVAMDWTLDLIISRSIAQIRPLQAASRYIQFFPGELVVEPGVDPGGLYVVISGAFDSETRSASGERATAESRVLGPGDTFGMPLNGDEGPEQDRVSAREASTVYFVEKGDLKRLAMASKLIKRAGRSRATAVGCPDQTGHGRTILSAATKAVTGIPRSARRRSEAGTPIGSSTAPDPDPRPAGGRADHERLVERPGVVLRQSRVSGTRPGHRVRRRYSSGEDSGSASFCGAVTRPGSRPRTGGRTAIRFSTWTAAPTRCRWTRRAARSP